MFPNAIVLRMLDDLSLLQVRLDGHDFFIVVDDRGEIHTTRAIKMHAEAAMVAMAEGGGQSILYDLSVGNDIQTATENTLRIFMHRKAK